jgi:hypothetical protein
MAKQKPILKAVPTAEQTASLASAPKVESPVPLPSHVSEAFETLLCATEATEGLGYILHELDTAYVDRERRLEAMRLGVASALVFTSEAVYKAQNVLYGEVTRLVKAASEAGAPPAA